MTHKHETRKTHVALIEYDDVHFDKLTKDVKYYGEGNSRNRRLDFDFEYCLGCSMRLLNGQPALIKGILDDEFECYVEQAKRGAYVAQREVTVQHSDFEVLARLIENALVLGKHKEQLPP